MQILNINMAKEISEQKVFCFDSFGLNTKKGSRIHQRSGKKDMMQDNLSKKEYKDSFKW